MQSRPRVSWGTTNLKKGGCNRWYEKDDYVVKGNCAVEIQTVKNFADSSTYYSVSVYQNLEKLQFHIDFS